MFVKLYVAGKYIVRFTMYTHLNIIYAIITILYYISSLNESYELCRYYYFIK